MSGLLDGMGGVERQVVALALSATEQQVALMAALRALSETNGEAGEREPRATGEAGGMAEVLAETTAEEWLAAAAAGGRAKVTQPQLVALMRQLQRMGAGELIVGRRRHKTRIRWRVAAGPLAAAFLAARDRADAGRAVSSGGLHDHRFLLRPGVQAVLSLPLDLTPEESQRLADFLRTVPFASDNDWAAGDGRR